MSWTQYDNSIRPEVFLASKVKVQIVAFKLMRLLPLPQQILPFPVISRQATLGLFHFNKSALAQFEGDQASAWVYLGSSVCLGRTDRG
jgi:hypothetical protein